MADCWLPEGRDLLSCSLLYSVLRAVPDTWLELKEMIIYLFHLCALKMHVDVFGGNKRAMV